MQCLWVGVHTEIELRCEPKQPDQKKKDLFKELLLIGLRTNSGVVRLLHERDLTLTLQKNGASLD